MKKLSLIALVLSTILLSGCSIRQLTTSNQQDMTAEEPTTQTQEKTPLEVSPVPTPEISSSQDLDTIQKEINDTEIEEDFGKLME